MGRQLVPKGQTLASMWPKGRHIHGACEQKVAAGGGLGLVFNGDRASVWQDQEHLETDSGAGSVATLMCRH